MLCIRPFWKLNLILNGPGSLQGILWSYVFCFNEGFFWSCKSQDQVWKECWAHTSSEPGSFPQDSGLVASHSRSSSSSSSSLPSPPPPFHHQDSSSLRGLLGSFATNPAPPGRLTLTCPDLWVLGLPCLVTSLLGPGMHVELIAELSSARGALAAGDPHFPPVTCPDF